MAEDQEDRTEAPSERAIQRAYDEGQVALGRDAVAWAGLLGGTTALTAVGPTLVNALRDLQVEALEALATRAALPPVLIVKPLALVLVVAAGAALGGMAATLAQTKAGIWMELAGLKPDRLFSVERVARLFSREVWQDLGASAIKLTVLLVVAWNAAKKPFLDLPRLLDTPDEALLWALFHDAGILALQLLGAMAVMAALDYALTRYRFLAKLKMTREEMKREMKEDEGDPQLRQQRKRRHRELSRNRIAVEVPKADAVVVNPTHIAVAIRYQRPKDKAPRVTAKGKGELAEHIRDLARQHGIPIVEDIPLARLLYKKVKVGQAVPAETYRAVATVLAFVYKVTGRR